MTKLSDISSTEKLLDLIRGNAEKTSEMADRPAPLKPSPEGRPWLKRRKFAPRKLSVLRRSVTIGVDFSREALRMVKMLASADNVWTLLDYKSVALPPTTPRNTSAYADFLREELNRFCNSEKRLRIWVVMSAARVDVRHIRIPKVSSGQVEKAVYWTVKKEASFDDKDSVFDFEVLSEVVEQGVPKLAVMVYIAPREEVEQIKDLFLRIGLPIVGVSIAPFAVQNIFRSGWISEPEAVANLFIGNDFSRIDIISQGNLVMTRDIKAGTNSMLESLQEALNERMGEPADPSTEKAPASMDLARRVLNRLSADAPSLTEGDPALMMREEEIFDSIQPALQRMIRQIERTFEHFTQTLGNERIGKIYIAGVLNFYRHIVAFIGDQLGIHGDILDPLDPWGAATRLTGMDITASPSERISLVPALGLALSDPRRTPNLIFTYKDKEKAANTLRTSRMTLLVFFLLVGLCSGIFSYQLFTVAQMKKSLSKLQHEISQFHPRVDRNAIMQMSIKDMQTKPSSKALIARYWGLAIIGELTASTSAGIRLTDMKINMGPAPMETGGGPTKEPSNEKLQSLVLEGVVVGQRKDLEGELARYVMKIETSPMFQQVSVQKSAFESVKRGVVLHFMISAKIV